MLLIGENIHVISKTVQTALIERNQNFIIDLIKKQTDCHTVSILIIKFEFLTLQN